MRTSGFAPQWSSLLLELALALRVFRSTKLLVLCSFGEISAFVRKYVNSGAFCLCVVYGHGNLRVILYTTFVLVTVCKEIVQCCGCRFTTILPINETNSDEHFRSAITAIVF